MHSFTRNVVDTVLRAAKAAFMPSDVKQTHERFPPTKQSLVRYKIQKVPSFWPLVMCTKRIDLTAFDLSPRLRRITFRFVDPIWAWICAATNQPATEMHWVPQRKTNPVYPRDYYYGEGVEFGESFAETSHTGLAPEPPV